MAENGNNLNTNGNVSPGEINTIRNILMGQQMSEYDVRFKELNDRLSSIEANLKDQINDLDAQQNDQMNALENETGIRFDKLEKLLEASITKLDDKLEKVSKADKVRLGKMLEKVSKQLIGE